VIANILIQCGLYLVVLLALAKPLGEFMARVLTGERHLLTPTLGWLERLTYKASGVDPQREMRWTEYAVATLLFNLTGLLVLYALQRTQGLLPLNPAELGAVSPDSSWNTAVSFATNTNWQGYGGESTVSYLTQMLGLAVQNFVSAATGIAVLAALARAFSRKQAGTIGNFWTDLTRSTLYILLPLSFILALALVSQGVVQTFGPYVKAQTVEKMEYEENKEKKTHAGAGPADGSRGLAGRDQAARHQRRRLLQRELFAPVRERDAALELPRDAVDPAYRGRAVRHFRPHGGRPAPGLGDPRRDDRGLCFAPGSRRSCGTGWKPDP
jgi:K+-transporting ATPase A subunit